MDVARATESETWVELPQWAETDEERTLFGNWVKIGRSRYYSSKKKKKEKYVIFCENEISSSKTTKTSWFLPRAGQPDFSFCLSVKTSERAIASTNNGTDFILIINCRVHYYEARRRRLVNRFRCAHRYRMRVTFPIARHRGNTRERAGKVLKPETIVAVSRGRDDFLCNRLALIHCI